MEDRWTAIRWAIGTAYGKDCVVIAGKGAEDFQEWDIGEGLIKVPL
jgi:UDP-N-acetylmuramyl tripeptide synthase